MGFKGALSTVRARLYLGFALLLAMILLLAGVVAYESYRIAEVNLERQQWASDTHQRVDDLEIDLLNMETGKRGYLLNGEESFLEPYEQGRRDFEGEIAISKTGMKMAKGACPVCGTTVNRILGKA